MKTRQKGSKTGRTISRRSVVKGAAVFAGAAPFIIPSRAFSQQKVLTLLSWPGYAAPEVVGPFEEEHGVKIVGKEYTGGDAMLALVNSSPPGTFDLILADAEFVRMLRGADIIETLNADDYPFDDYWPEFSDFPGLNEDGKLYGIMTSFGYLGLTYNTEKLTPKDVTSYKVLWDEKVKGQVGMYDWYLPPMLCLSLYNGNRPPFDISDAKFAELSATLMSLKDQMVGIGSFSGTFSMLSQGEAWAFVGTGAWLTTLLKKDGVPVADVIPEEGGIQWTEAMTQVKGSKNPDLAVKFLQYMASPEGQVRTAIKPAYSGSIPSKAGWKKLNAEYPEWADLLEHRLDKRNIMDDYGKIQIRDLPKQQELSEWNQAFTEFKSSL
jgi:spermidine/putrescine transport system substrate-binding protein